MHSSPSSPPARRRTRTPDWSKSKPPPAPTPDPDPPRTRQHPIPPEPAPARTGRSRPPGTGARTPRTSAAPDRTPLRRLQPEELPPHDALRGRAADPRRPKPDKEIEATRHDPRRRGTRRPRRLRDRYPRRPRRPPGAPREAGLDLPHSEHAGGTDEDRHLALLSRYPITSRRSPAEAHLPLQGETMAMSRGILDATVDVRGHHFRFLGVHLKSKRDIPEARPGADAPQRSLPPPQARRRHPREDPEVFLCVYGDFNDTRRSTPSTPSRDPTTPRTYLEPSTSPTPAARSGPITGTTKHVYSRFDYVLVSRPSANPSSDDHCHILDAPETLPPATTAPSSLCSTWTHQGRDQHKGKRDDRDECE